VLQPLPGSPKAAWTRPPHMPYAKGLLFFLDPTVKSPPSRVALLAIGHLVSRRLLPQTRDRRRLQNPYAETDPRRDLRSATSGLPCERDVVLTPTTAVLTKSSTKEAW
jgi:hypothetical protein